MIKIAEFENGSKKVVIWAIDEQFRLFFYDYGKEVNQLPFKGIVRDAELIAENFCNSESEPILLVE